MSPQDSRFLFVDVADAAIFIFLVTINIQKRAKAITYSGTQAFCSPAVSQLYVKETFCTKLHAQNKAKTKKKHDLRSTPTEQVLNAFFIHKNKIK